MGVLIAQGRAVKSNNYMVEVDPLIESLYRWSDISGVLLMGIIGGTMARKRGYDIIGFFFRKMFSDFHTQDDVSSFVHIKETFVEYIRFLYFI